MAVNENPYPECEKCQDLSDCKNAEVTLNEFGLSLPHPPEDCPRPKKIRKATNEKYKQSFNRHERHST